MLIAEQLQFMNRKKSSRCVDLKIFICFLKNNADREREFSEFSGCDETYETVLNSRDDGSSLSHSSFDDCTQFFIFLLKIKKKSLPNLCE